MEESYAKSFGVSETPAAKVMHLLDGRFLLASLRSSPRPFDGLSRFALPLMIESPPAAPLSFRSEPETLIKRILTQARYYLGTPYRWGSSLWTGSTTDCSGFVQFIYKKFNITLPRSSPEQARVGMVVAKTLDFAKMLPGDLPFFGLKGRHIGHVGIYLGDGKMIHASSRLGVIIADLRQTFHEGAFVVAKRLLSLNKVYPETP
jgi:hypothetical protein